MAWIELSRLRLKRKEFAGVLPRLHTPCKRSSLLLAEPEASFTSAFALSNTAQTQSSAFKFFFIQTKSPNYENITGWVCVLCLCASENYIALQVSVANGKSVSTQMCFSIPRSVQTRHENTPLFPSQKWHSRPQSLRSFWPAAGIESSGNNHFRHAP